MRCSTCGLPLSPMRTSCPRCGTNYNGSSASIDALSAQGNSSAAGNFSPGYDLPTSPVGSHAQWNGYSPPLLSNEAIGFNGQATVEVPQESFPIVNEQPFFEPSFNTSQPKWPSVAAPQTTWPSAEWKPAPTISRSSEHIADKRRRRTIQIGFTLAIICLIIGAVLLTIVALMIQSPLSPK